MSNILHSQDQDSVLAHVSQNLKRLRGRAGLSQAGLAEASGISRRMIVAVESGDANISLSSLDKLAAAMGVGFVDLVRDPTRDAMNVIDQVLWRGPKPGSEATLLASTPAASEAQLWHWHLSPGDSYTAEPDPQGWHEMVFVIDGTLTLDLSGRQQSLTPGRYAAYRSDQEYAYLNRAEIDLRFVRVVVS